MKDSFRASRKAVGLIVGDNHATDYIICKLQVVPRPSGVLGSYIERQPFEVIAEVAAVGTVGDKTDLFLSGSAFAFNLEDGNKPSDLTRGIDPWIATLGVTRPSGRGLDAFAVSSETLTHVG